MKLPFQLFLAFLAANLPVDAKSLRALPTTSDSDESRNLDICAKKVVTYGAPITIENDVESSIEAKRYLANGIDTIKAKTYESPDKWNILSTAKPFEQLQYSANVPKPEDDPKYGECIKFGDKIVLFNGTVDESDPNLRYKYILAAGSYSVYLTYGFVNGLEVKSNEQMEFIIRSNTGNGYRSFPDLRKGRCVEDGDKIFLQANNMDSKYIRRDGNEVYSRNLFDEKERTVDYQTYNWIVRLNFS